MTPLLLLLACTDAPEPQETADTDTAHTDTDTGSELTGPTSHCGTIKADATWDPLGNPHIVTCDLEIEGATLTLLPGTVVEVADGKAILVANSGAASSLQSLGTAEAPVLIRGARPDNAVSTWLGVTVKQHAHDVVLTHTTIWGGGSAPKGGNLVAENVGLRLENVTFKHSKGAGLRLKSEAWIEEGSRDLTVSNADDWAVYVDAAKAHTVPAQGSKLTGNSRDGVAVNGGPLDTSVAWEDLGVPYVVIGGDLTLDGYAWRPAVLTIGPGVTVLFEEKRRLELSMKDGASGLMLLGTPDAQVTLSSLGSASGGYWGGIEAARWVVPESFELHNAVIEWTGAVGTAALTVRDAPVLLDNVTLRTTKKAGFNLVGDASFAEGSGGIKITGCAFAGTIAPHRVESIPADSVQISGNEVDVVKIAKGSIRESTTWMRLPVPYWIDGDVMVDGLADRPAVLGIAPGTTLWMANGTSLQIANDGGAAGLVAEGTATHPILFTAAQVAEGGAWNGIGLYDHCEESEVRLDYVRVEYGGGGTPKANLFLDGCNPARVDHTTLYGSLNFGMRAKASWPQSLVELNAYGNVGDDVKCEPGACPL